MGWRAAVADDLRADLDQHFLQARQRTSPGSARAPPACRKFAEVVAECVKLELHGVGSERAACQPSPLDRAFADKSGRSFRSPLSMEGVDCCGFLPDCLDPYAIEHGDEGELGFGYRGFGLSSTLDENADENYELLLNTIATSLDRIAAKPVA